MSVFSRLYQDSVSGKNRVTRSQIADYKTAEEETWKLRLAAECHLVDNVPSSARSTRNISVSSLSSRPLHRPRGSRPKTLPSPLIMSARRPVSVVMGTSGVEVTDYYYVTDSIEPPPYVAVKPRSPLRPTPIEVIEEEERGQIPRVPINKMKMEIQKNKSPQINWANSAESALDHTLVMANDNTKNRRVPPPKRIVIDQVKKLDLSKVPHAVPMISSTGSCWESSGFPNSLSQII